MKVAVFGSRNLVVRDLTKYLPVETDEIVSGGARGIDACAAEYAKSHGLKLTEFKPDYSRFGRGAPLKRNISIIEYNYSYCTHYRTVSVKYLRGCTKVC